MTQPARDGSEDGLRRLRELEAIARIASSFTFEQPLEAMMEEVSRQVVQATGSAIACIVGLMDPVTQTATTVVASSGVPTGFNQVLQRAWQTGGTPVVSGSLRTRKAQVVDLNTVLQRPGYEEVRQAQRLAGWETMAVVPMIYRGAGTGLLIVAYQAGKEPDANELAFLEAISDQAAVALENSRLFEQARTLAVVEERQRFSRDLHDSVSQALYAISLGAQTARELMDSDPSSAIEPIDYVVSLADAALAEMRAMIFDLRPEALAQEGLVAALRRQAASVRARHQIEVEARLESEPAISLHAKEMLYRVAQEALQNVVKHARADAVTLSLSDVGGVVCLTVQDNGRGFSLADEFPGHLGLTSMRERASQAGAAFEVATAPGEGCTIAVRLSVDRLANSRTAT